MKPHQRRSTFRHLSRCSLLSVGNSLQALLALILYIYAILGVEFFHQVAHGEFVTEDANFSSFGFAMLTLFRCITGESYNGIMHDVSITEQGSAPGRCYDKDGNCGNPTIAIPYFLSYVVIGSFVMLNVFVAVILDAFAEDAAAEQVEFGPLQIDEFTEVWQRFISGNVEVSAGTPRGISKVEVHSDSVLPTKHLVSLLKELNAPMGFKDARNPPTAGELMQRVKELNVPDRGGFIGFHDLLQAFAKRSVGEAQLPPADTEIGQALRDVRDAALSEPIYERVKETKVGGEDVSAEKIAAALTVQAAFRRKQMRKARDGKAAAKQAGTKSRPFALKRSAQDNLLTLGAAPPVRPKQAAQRHSLADCLVAGPQGDLSFALPAAAAEIKERGVMFRSWLSRDGDALAWMELRHCTKRWNQSVPLTPAEGSEEERADTETGEAGPDGATAGGDECAWDETDAWGGAEEWGDREWGGSSNAWRGAGGAAPHGRNDAQGSGVTEGAQLGACPVRAEEEEDEVIEVEESEASWGADGDVGGGGVPSDSEGDAHSRGMPLIDEPLTRPPLHGMPRSPRGDEDAPPVRPLEPGAPANRASPLEPPGAAPLPSRRASLPQLGSFVARCIAGGAVKLSDVLSAAGSTGLAASGAPVPADAPPSAQRVLALVANVVCPGPSKGRRPVCHCPSFAARTSPTFCHPRCSSRCCGSHRSTTQGNTHGPSFCVL